MNKSIPTL